MNLLLYDVCCRRENIDVHFCKQKQMLLVEDFDSSTISLHSPGDSSIDTTLTDVSIAWGHTHTKVGNRGSGCRLYTVFGCGTPYERPVPYIMESSN